MIKESQGAIPLSFKPVSCHNQRTVGPDLLKQNPASNLNDKAIRLIE